MLKKYFFINKIFNKYYSSLAKDLSTRNSILIYNEVLKDKVSLLKDLKGKSGIYMWINKTNNKIYIGSSIDLKSRISGYLKNSVLIRDKSMPICAALMKYGYSGFTLEILEFCDKDDVIDRENYYFNLYNPDYNIVKVAGKPPVVVFTPDIKKKISDSLKEYYSDPINREKNFYKRESHKLIAIDTINDTVTEFYSIKSAARLLNIDRRIITKALKSEIDLIINERYYFKPVGLMKDIAIKVQVHSKALDILDLGTNIKTRYESIASAAEAINVYPQSINMYLKNKSNKPFKNKYVITLV